jgi:SAM-dependent methyltransferase
MSAKESIVFDRAAEFYDRTRALPDEVQARVTELLAAELRDGRRVLELGVGTGRMALPLHERGIDLVGIDLSEPMMRKLVENAGGAMVLPLVQADGLALPLRDGAVRSAFLCHVLHLIPRWTDVVAELVRVVAPGGRVLVDLGGGPTAIGREVSEAFNRFASLDRPRPGCTDASDLDRAFAGHGATLRLTAPITFCPSFTIAGLLHRMEGNLFSSTWSLSDEARADAVAATRAWAVERFGDLDARRTDEVTIQWRAYELA